jgi:energy-coupling factor transporter ATP-binding protein EcfA2
MEVIAATTDPAPRLLTPSDKFLKTITVPLFEDGKSIEFNFIAGRSVVIVGANGAGKSRLGAHLEQIVGTSHRISAQRSLQFTEDISLVDFDRAEKDLIYGHPTAGNKIGHRWQGHPVSQRLDDYDRLLRALFSQQNKIANEHLRNFYEKVEATAPDSMLRKLLKIWNDLLPHRTVVIGANDVKVKPDPADTTNSRAYSAREMSDGERVFFYLVGQALMAPADSVIIIDEPELHLHRAILDKLWDRIETERPDCSFVYITHDIDFAVGRITAEKYFVRGIRANSRWSIEPIPINTGLPEHVVIELVGNRKPVLFTEGTADSFDTAIYRALYPSFKIEPVGNCDAVVHSVASFRKNGTMHSFGQVYGSIDADHRTREQITLLERKGIFILPVAEIENAFLLPSIFTVLAQELSFSKPDSEAMATRLRDEVVNRLKENLDNVIARCAARQLDRQLKILTVIQSGTADLIKTYEAEIAKISIVKTVENIRAEFEVAIKRSDIDSILALYDNKDLLNVASKFLGTSGPKSLIQFAARLLTDETKPTLREAFLKLVPAIPQA